jgi:CheY-like chemotaxis protein
MSFLDLLLVEDDDNDRALFAIAVDKAGLNICLQTVTNGEEAIDYLEGRRIYADRALHPLPALLVLDLDMPLSGGLDFLRWRTSSAAFASLPVIIYSGFAYKGAIEAALRMGASAFISKPCEFDGMKAVIRQIWDFWDKSPQAAAA